MEKHRCQSSINAMLDALTFIAMPSLTRVVDLDAEAAALPACECFSAQDMDKVITSTTG
jgi:hypothetical protein